MNKKFTTLATILIVALFFLTACGASSSGPGNYDTTPTASPTATQPAATLQANQCTPMHYGSIVLYANKGEVGLTTTYWSDGNHIVTYSCRQYNGVWAIGIDSDVAQSVANAPAATNTEIAPANTGIDANSCGASVDAPTSYDVFSNNDVGDPGMISVVYGWDKVNKDTAFIGVIDIMKNLDFENPAIQGQYLHFTNKNDAICYARNMASKLGVKNLIYVSDDNDTPEGFTKNLPVPGWKMSVTTYTDKPIEIKDAVWTTLNVSTSDDHTFAAGSNLVYGQFWDGVDSSVVYHFIVKQGFKLETPKYQGTWYQVSGGDFEMVLKRFIQMTAEVVQRDDAPTVHQIVCDESPILMDGWTCTKQ